MVTVTVTGKDPTSWAFLTCLAPSWGLGFAGDIAGINWVAVKELKLSYYIGETLLFTIYTHYGNLIQVP